MKLSRRDFALSTLGLAAVSALPGSAVGATARRPYAGPNVVIIRYGGGVRRRETIEPQHSFSPYLAKVLLTQGTLYPLMRIEARDGVVTSHAQGTLNILTGRYDRYENIAPRFGEERFEAKAPTLFEYLRATYDVPAHQALIVNGENRPDEDILVYSNDPHYGIRYHSSVVSLTQFKAHLLRRGIAAGAFQGDELVKAQLQLTQLEAADMKREIVRPSPTLETFWDGWRRDYGDSGLKNPRGDRLLTALSLRAMKELKPKLMLVNYQDPDYVHWGNASHYTRAIGVIDDGIRQIVEAAEAEPHYRGNTVFFVTPDCGRDNNAMMQVPYQHHFNSKSAHESWALAFGRGIARGTVVDKTVEQIAVARTVAQVMGFNAASAESPILQEVFA
ncbi:MAG: hypothetical protein KBA31_06210 [Alphaproteobacteria bacterium]|nr:hypothetical protein [Alphaproteobacteria bacterium]